MFVRQSSSGHWQSRPAGLLGSTRPMYSLCGAAVLPFCLTANYTSRSDNYSPLKKMGSVQLLCFRDWLEHSDT